MFVKTAHHKQLLLLPHLPVKRLHQSQFIARDMAKLVQGAFAIVMLVMKVTNVTLRIVKISWPDLTVVSGVYSRDFWKRTFKLIFFSVNANWIRIRRKCIVVRRLHYHHWIHLQRNLQLFQLQQNHGQFQLLQINVSNNFELSWIELIEPFRGILWFEYSEWSVCCW